MTAPAHKLPPAFLTTPITHRTLHDVTDGRPENSVEGAQAAIAHGYGIEIDLQLSSDGVAMVFHDYDLDRLTAETGLVADRTATGLATIPLNGGKYGIPTFASFLKIVNGAIPLLVELKPQNRAFGAETDAMVLSVKQALEGYTGDIAFMSFNPHMVATFADHLPDYPRGLTTDPFAAKHWPDIPDTLLPNLADMTMYASVGASFISHNVNDLHSDIVAKRMAEGADILCWTIKSKAQEQTARAIAHNITFEQYLADGGAHG